MNPFYELLERESRRTQFKASQPGDQTPASGAGFMNEYSSIPDLETRQGENGETIPPMIWDVDNWDQADWV